MSTKKETTSKSKKSQSKSELDYEPDPEFVSDPKNYPHERKEIEEELKNWSSDSDIKIVPGKNGSLKRLTLAKTSRPTPYREELSNIPIEAIATLAVRLAGHNADITPSEATNKALEFLEYAAAAHRELNLPPEESSRWVEEIELLENFKKGWDQGLEDMIPDFKPRKSYYPFKEVLKKLMPDARKVKPADRIPRLRKWIMEYYLRDDVVAGRIIGIWKKGGVPHHAWGVIRETWHPWFREHKSKVRKEVGKKGKQGQVKSKSDKRLGARPPKLVKYTNKST